uniref:Chymotrypsin C n=1 Tax=Rhinolophus ferrumequinum TaxID=59479 RepID=A0A671EUM1_RHIFE
MLGLTVLAAFLACATPGPIEWPWGRTTWEWTMRKAPCSLAWIPSLFTRSGTPSWCAMTLPSSSWRSPWR